MKAIVGQSFIDIAIQTTGSASEAFALAFANFASLTDVPGAYITEVDVVDQDIADFYANAGLTPATANDALISGGNGIFLAYTHMNNTLTIAACQQQSVIDMAIQTTGDASAALAFALVNNLSLTDLPSAGIKMALINVVNKQVRDYYKNNGITPTTGLSAQIKRPRIFSNQFALQFT
jgi:hypothetical protein